MKITKQDKEMFAGFHNSVIGNQLLDYLSRMEGEICDVRNMKAGESSETIKRILGVIQANLVDKIKLQSQPKEVSREDFI